MGQMAHYPIQLDFIRTITNYLKLFKNFNIFFWYNILKCTNVLPCFQIDSSILLSKVENFLCNLIMHDSSDSNILLRWIWNAFQSIFVQIHRMYHYDFVLLFNVLLRGSIQNALIALFEQPFMSCFHPQEDIEYTKRHGLRINKYYQLVFNKIVQ